MPNELNISGRYAQWAIQGLTRLLAAFAVFQGLLIAFTDPRRWSTPSYVVAIQVPGAPPSWGISLVVIGAAALAFSFTRKMRAVSISLFLFSLWSASFMVVSVAAVLQNPLASTSFTWVFFMIIGGCLSVIYWQSWSLNQTLAERVRNEIRDQAT